MKKIFIINFVLILLMVFLFAIAAKNDMWFSATVTVLICAAIIFRQMIAFRQYDGLLRNEKERVVIMRNRALERETELSFHKAILNEVDTAVIVSTGSGYIEWQNCAAINLLASNEVLPSDIIDVISRRHGCVIIDGKEYAANSKCVVMQNTARYIIVLENIHNAIEKSTVESWHKLVRVLTHEIMNSMTPIISLSKTLCSAAEDTDFCNDSENVNILRSGLQIINRRSSGLMSFVDNYRKLMSVSPPDKSSFSLKSLMQDILQLFAQPFIEFKDDICSEQEIFADRAQIEQVIINLLKNAIEACEARENEDGYKKRVFCGIDGNGDSVSITISDNGVGMMPSVCEQIFIPFFTTKKNGSGIGLSLCKQILMNHNGDIEVNSKQNCGCEVVVTLPI